MKYLNIIILILIAVSIAFSQEIQVKTNRDKANVDQKEEKREKSTEKVNDAITDKTNTVNIQKQNQKVTPKIIKNSAREETKQKKFFGSVSTSDKKVTIEKKSEDQIPLNTETKEKVRKLSKTAVKLKKSD